MHENWCITWHHAEAQLSLNERAPPPESQLRQDWQAISWSMRLPMMCYHWMVSNMLQQLKNTTVIQQPGIEWAKHISSPDNVKHKALEAAHNSTPNNWLQGKETKGCKRGKYGRESGCSKYEENVVTSDKMLQAANMQLQYNILGTWSVTLNAYNIKIHLSGLCCCVCFAGSWRCMHPDRFIYQWYHVTLRWLSPYAATDTCMAIRALNAEACQHALPSRTWLTAEPCWIKADPSNESSEYVSI